MKVSDGSRLRNKIKNVVVVVIVVFVVIIAITGTISSVKVLPTFLTSFLPSFLPSVNVRSLSSLSSFFHSHPPFFLFFLLSLKKQEPPFIGSSLPSFYSVFPRSSSYLPSRRTSFLQRCFAASCTFSTSASLAKKFEDQREYKDQQPLPPFVFVFLLISYSQLLWKLCRASR